MRISTAANIRSGALGNATRPNSAKGSSRNRSARFAAMAALSLIAAISLMASGALAQPRGGRDAGPSRNSVSERAATDRVIVKFKHDARASAVGMALVQAGVRVLKTMRFSGVSVLEVVEKDKSIGEVIQSLQESGVVEYAEPDFIVHVDSTVPNDPLFPQLWGMEAINAPEAWDITTGSSDVVAAVIDTGVDYTHQDLSENMWRNPGEIPNGIDDDQNGYVDDVHGINCITGSGDPFDDHSHGTHVAGTIGGKGNNGIGVVGVNWDVSIMALKFLSAGGSGYTSDAIECIDYATRMATDFGVNLKVTNNSWGGGEYSQGLYDAIEASGGAGMLFAAAAGNNYGSNTDIEPHYPSSYDLDYIIAVASTDENDGFSYFSNFGPISVDLAAPGENILSTIPGNGYASFDGTSMATPHVSGAAALIWGLHPSSDPVGMKMLLCNSVDEVPALQGTTVCGGRLNVSSALQSCETNEVAMRISPTEGFAVPIYQEALVTVSLARCASSITGATVTVDPSNGDESFLAHDDGVAPDAYADDGTYSASWTPGAEGSVVLALEAVFSGGSVEGNVTGEVVEVPNYVAYDDVLTFSWVDATQGTNTGIDQLDEYVEIPIGFDFTFYGETHDTVKVASHGYLTFGSDATDWSNDPIPSSQDPNGVIAPYWNDFNLSWGGAVYYLLEGEAPKRTLTIEWLNVPYYDYGTTASATFEVTLFEHKNRMIFQYLDVDSGDALYDFGQSATVGIEDPTGSYGVEYSYNQPSISNSMLIWIREAPQCDDGRDNDDDAMIDYPDDQQCWSKYDEKEGKCGLLGIEILLVYPLAWAVRHGGRRLSQKAR